MISLTSCASFGPMATGSAIRPVNPAAREVKAYRPRWSTAAWGSIMLATLFIVASCWWLSQDESIPVDDAGNHLSFAVSAYKALNAGHLLQAFTLVGLPYPPLTHIVGAVGIFVGGVGVTPPIIALNLVFVPLLALGCYQVGRLAFGPLAGLLAVAFALGSPLIIEQFHEVMLDAPEAAIVALTLWAVLATERFSNLKVSVIAGIAVGLGMLSKQTFVYYITGIVLVTAVRGGWRAWRGVAVFAVVALVIALPWYLYELPNLSLVGSVAFGPSTEAPQGIAPPRLSMVNLEWYFWSILNWQLYLPLFAFSVAGGIWTTFGLARRRPVSDFAPELVLGAFISWLAVTMTYNHDPRYTIPMVVFLAVLGVGWVSRLPRHMRVAVATLLVLVALANSLGVAFGVGNNIKLGTYTSPDLQLPGVVRLFTTEGYSIGAPTRNGSILRLLRALHRAGVREVRWNSVEETELDYSWPGMVALAQIAGLTVASESVDPLRAKRDYAFFRRGSPRLGTPCIVLSDETGVWGVWVRLGGPQHGPEAWTYCPANS